MKLLLVPPELIPAVLLLPAEFETIMFFEPAARMPVPLLLQVLFATTLSFPPLISIPVVLFWQVLLTTLAQAQESQIPVELLWQLLSTQTAWVAFWMLMPACSGLPETSQRVTVSSLS